MSEALPEAFLEQVKDVLENLYDFPFLNRHPLAQSTRAGQPNEPAGHRLRREVVEAIEAFRPVENGGARPNAARLYNLLHLHYVGGMTLPEVANDLGISVRQAYRDLRHGHESVGEILWFNRQGKSESAPLDTAEVERINDRLTANNITAILENAIKAVQRLAEQQNLRLDAAIPADPIVISTNPTAAQQIFIHVLSQTIQQSSSGVLRIELRATSDEAQLELRYPPRDPDTLDVPITAVIQNFIQQLHFSITVDAEVGGAHRLCLTMPAQRSTVLIVDDNQGLIDLLQRYFAGQSYKVLAASTGADGLKLADDLQPDAMIMDLMMPGMDGWEVLQRLRTNPRTVNIPVIICSVINDPELAYSLGASLFISKPISKDHILDALREIGL